MKQALQKPFSRVATILIILRLLILTVKFLLPIHSYYLDRVQNNRLSYYYLQILTIGYHTLKYGFLQHQWEDHLIIQFPQNSLLFLGQTLSLILPRHIIGPIVSPKLNTLQFCGTYLTLIRSKRSISLFTWCRKRSNWACLS